jgi:hypothetical protein
MFAEGKPAGAIAEYREAFRRRPCTTEAHSDLGLAPVYQGKVEEAAAGFRTAIQLSPDLPRRSRLNSLGWSARIEQNYKFLPENLNISNYVSCHRCRQARVIPCAMPRAISSPTARIARPG